ncbi:hypothetical protein F0L68_10485 [Solihabitans fulvus]|uniref:META domain-containing protein n=1 Tax=Solihabitans fulvus TaxID=1892852 RepID=A0A5B2XHB6_9PSEU|nr:hypothetical protein [Solihabitans fulvus]KAA2263238.1 hypothetical protein F0L68_10485 [Solihabitans fulvus]
MRAIGRILLVAAGAAAVLASAGCGARNTADVAIAANASGSSGSASASSAPSSSSQAAPSAAAAPATVAPVGTPTKPPAVRPADVPVAWMISMNSGVVQWRDARMVHTPTDDSAAEPVPGGQQHSARLAPDATFFAPLSCGGQENGLKLGPDGLGAIPCSREGFAAYVMRNALSAPKIFFGPDGTIVKMAARYHP